MITVLITGSNGQLGSEIKSLSNQYSQLNFIFTDVDELDITNEFELKNYFSVNKIDFIVNCAAYTAVDKAETDKDNAYKINVTAAENLAEISNNFGTTLIHVSTDYVFNGHNYRPYCEEDITNPASVYGFTKEKGEKAVELFADKWYIVRTSWLYSQFKHNFVKTMLRLGHEKDKLAVVFDQVGTPTNAEDLASAILQIIDYNINNKDKHYGIYHYSNEGVCSWYDFAKQIMRIADLNCEVNPIETKDFPTAAKRPFYSVMNKSKIKENFNIEIPYWKDSLAKCIEKIK